MTYANTYHEIIPECEGLEDFAGLKYICKGSFGKGRKTIPLLGMGKLQSDCDAREFS